MREIDLVRFDAAGADRNSLRLEKSVRHRAADQNGVGLFHQRLEHADLIGNFRAAHDDEEWLGRMIEFLVQIFAALSPSESPSPIARRTS